LNFKRVKLELKKDLYQTRVDFEDE